MWSNICLVFFLLKIRSNPSPSFVRTALLNALVHYALIMNEIDIQEIIYPNKILEAKKHSEKVYILLRKNLGLKCVLSKCIFDKSIVMLVTSWLQAVAPVSNKLCVFSCIWSISAGLVDELQGVVVGNDVASSYSFSNIVSKAPKYVYCPPAHLNRHTSSHEQFVKY